MSQQIADAIGNNVDLQYALDDLVDRVASEAASAANNGGIQAQVNFCRQHGWSEEEILDYLFNE